MTDYTLHHGDCLDVMARMDADSVDLIIADPPYFKVKGEWWDRQWGDADAYFAWLGGVFDEFTRILAPNGSVYVFADTRRSARTEMLIAERLNVLNRLTWVKPSPGSPLNHGAGRSGSVSKETLRSYFPQTEAVLFCEQYDGAGYEQKCDELRGSVFEPLRAYLDGERKRAGVDKADCNAACGFSRSAGGMASRHYFSQSQWCLPTAAHYTAMQKLFSSYGQYLQRDYSELRSEYGNLWNKYEELRREYEELRRPFTWADGRPYTDVWTYGTISHYPGKHPCEKPQDMLCDMIRTSSREGATVFDPFTGSGATGQAALECGRIFIGVEIDDHWHESATNRIDAANKQGSLFAEEAA